MFVPVARQKRGSVTMQQFYSCVIYNPFFTLRDRCLSFWKHHSCDFCWRYFVQLLLHLSIDSMGEKPHLCLSVPRIHFSFNEPKSSTCYGAFHFLKIAGMVLLAGVFSLSHLVVCNFQRRDGYHIYMLRRFKKVMYQHLETYATTRGHKHKSLFEYYLMNDFSCKIKN